MWQVLEENDKGTTMAKQAGTGVIVRVDYQILDAQGRQTKAISMVYVPDVTVEDLQ